MRIIKQIERNILINGENYPLKIVYKTQKRYITYYFKGDYFLVTSPLGINELKIEEQVKQLAPKLMKSRQRPALEGDDFIYIYGKRYELDQTPITIDGETINYLTKGELKYYLNKLYLKRVKELVKYYKDLMGIKREYNIKVKDLKSRYGSNSRATYTLVFNVNLMHYDIEMSKSVIVHELAHCFEFNHSKAFYDIVYKYYPNYDEISYKLKKGIVK